MRTEILGRVPADRVRLPDVDAEVIASVLRAARLHLGMDVGFVAELAEREQLVFCLVEGDAASFQLRTGRADRLSETFCARLLEGRIPTVVTDADAEPEVRALPITAEMGIGAYVGVPIRAADGTPRGTLCCMSHQAEPALVDRDMRFMHVLAQVIGDRMQDAWRHEPDENPRTALTPRETAVVQLLACGWTAEDAGRRLGVSTTTVQTHLRNAIRRLGARGRTHAIALALHGGHISLERCPDAPAG